MLDILDGDFLIVGTDEYPIRSCAEWNDNRMLTPGFRRMANTTASTKRPARVGSSGKRANPEINLSGLKCTPLDPVDPELRKRLELDTPHTLLQTFVTNGSGFVRLILEDLKR